ncbi:MAG: hypothetical protein GX616_11375 [Planctomycetes bacterium]|nr:hypothetical protein [Planctomycetota bacterium]
MAIRFACPSCRQPIEIDDEWAGQSVGCPYCRKVITAPAVSSWPSEQVPVATPLRQPTEPIMPPPGYPVHPPAQGASAAPWALTMAITSALLSMFASMVWLGTWVNVVAEKAGRNATQEEIQKIASELAANGQIPYSPLAMAAAVVGSLCGIGGLVLAIRTLLWQQPRRGMAIAACIISVAFSCCGGLLVFMSLASRAAQP